MDTNDLFQWGITPLKGENAGKHYRVLNFGPQKVTVAEWDAGTELVQFNHGEYKIWQPPKTLFEDDSVPSTWGELKKAFEAEKLPDDTRLVTPDGDTIIMSFLSGFNTQKAVFRLRTGTDGKKVVLIY